MEERCIMNENTHNISMLSDSTKEIEIILEHLKKVFELCSILYDKLEDNEIDTSVDWQNEICLNRLAYVLHEAEVNSEWTIEDLQKELTKRKKNTEKTQNEENCT